MTIELDDPASAVPSDLGEVRGSVLLAPVLVVEDDAPMQMRIARVLTALGYCPEALAFAKSIAEALALMATQRYALALVDIGLPDGSGVSLMEQLRANDPIVPILVISAWSTEDVILNALRSGATGYVLKERDDIELSLSIRSVLRGGAPIDPFIARRILELASLSTPAPGFADDAGLSPREREILLFVAQGLTNREIAQKIFLSRHTVECHIKNIYRKLAVSTRTKAVFEGRSRGLLP